MSDAPEVPSGQLPFPANPDLTSSQREHFTSEPAVLRRQRDAGQIAREYAEVDRIDDRIFDLQVTSRTEHRELAQMSPRRTLPT